MKKLLTDFRKPWAVNKGQWTLKSILNEANVSCCYRGIQRVIGKGRKVDNEFK